jgi:hypothetical protein
VNETHRSLVAAPPSIPHVASSAGGGCRSSSCLRSAAAPYAYRVAAPATASVDIGIYNTRCESCDTNARMHADTRALQLPHCQLATTSLELSNDCEQQPAQSAHELPPLTVACCQFIETHSTEGDGHTVPTKQSSWPVRTCLRECRCLQGTATHTTRCAQCHSGISDFERRWNVITACRSVNRIVRCFSCSLTPTTNKLRMCPNVGEGPFGSRQVATQIGIPTLTV